jgi:hypothetical protein
MGYQYKEVANAKDTHTATNYSSLCTPVGVALTLVSSVHGVLAAPFPATDCVGTPELADGLGRCP